MRLPWTSSTRRKWISSDKLTEGTAIERMRRSDFIAEATVLEAIYELDERVRRIEQVVISDFG